MKEIHYDFVDLDSDESFGQLGKTFGGILKNKTLLFDNHIVKGELVKATPESGLWIRKWKFTTLEKIVLHKHKAPIENEKKFVLIYFLNPSIFSLSQKKKQLRINNPCNNIFLTSGTDIDFSVIPKQPFYVLDLAFTVSWFFEQFSDADRRLKDAVNQFALKQENNILKQPCSKQEFVLLRELESGMNATTDQDLFLRSRVYNLLFLFFTRLANPDEPQVIKRKINYEQIMQVNEIINENLNDLPSLEIIAAKVNLSVSSLLRQFQLVYGKSIREYHVERKMELAKDLILEQGCSVKKVAEKLGYNHASHFIESFAKYHGYTPGSLKEVDI